jgi:hypothetical protein
MEKGPAARPALFVHLPCVRMRVLVLMSSMALVVVAGAQATVARGTLAGVVMRGPITPVCAIEQPCSEPAKNVTLLFSRNDEVVGRAVTDEQGRYRLRLRAGPYSVRLRGASPVGRKLEPNRVRVAAGRRTNIDFFIDTGIR